MQNTQEHIINVLPPHVADLIAAGEVVERPASVVKELMENAIDAGAMALTVEIENGGMTYIRVTDDGCGMSEADARLCTARHATAKIKGERDLEAIATLGFRGEALAAISAVSRMEIMTRRPADPEGTAVELAAGEETAVSPVGCPAGTTMVVRDLFYNTPARLKFMKKDAYEASAVRQAVIRIALSHPEVSVKYLRDGEQELLTPGDGVLLNAIYSALGRDLALGLLPVHWEDERAVVDGFVTGPTANRGNRGYQYFFVNGRHIKSPAMAGALEAAYKNRIMVGRFPGCVLQVKVRPASVDVNVHPAKTEVKFFGERAVCDAVYQAARGALDAEQRVPEQKPAVEKSRPREDFFRTMTAEEFRREPARPAMATRPAAPVEKPTVRPAADLSLLEQARRAPAPAPEPVPAPSRLWDGGDRAAAYNVPAEDPDVSAETPPAAQPAPAPEPAVAEMPAPEPTLFETPAPTYRLVGETLKTYILVEQGDALILIDKHAAHERMIFDRLSASDAPVMMQSLLLSVTYTPAPEEREALLENAELLLELGFEIEDFGGGSVVIRQAPADVDTSELVPLLSEIGAALVQSGRVESPRERILHSMACKAAIKAGRSSDPAELDRLCRAVLSGQVKYCPHGRPVAVTLTKGKLDKLFGRA